MTPVSGITTHNGTARLDARQILALLALAVTDFLVMLDGLLVTVILPDIQSALGFSRVGLGWVVTAYVLFFAGCMLLAGRVADLYGRRRLLLIGYTLFGLGALVSGLATSAGVMVAGRALQGLGAAAMTPAGLSLLTETFPSGKARDRALGVWATAGSLGIPVGALLGGLVAHAAGWRWVLLMNVPAALLGAILALIALRESRARESVRSLDVRGAVLVTFGLAALTLGIAEIEPLVSGRGTAFVPGLWGLLTTLLAACVLLALFARTEVRVASPLVSVSLLRVPGVLRANLAACGLPVGLGGMMFIATQYLQEIRGLSTWSTGLCYLALAVPVTLFSPIAPRMVERFGRRHTATIGFAMQATGLGILAFVPGSDVGVWLVLLAFFVTGAGAPIAFIPVTAAAVEDVGDDSGVASGLFNTTQQVANVVALSLVAFGVALGSSESADGEGISLNGVHTGFMIAAVLAVGAAVAAARLRTPVPTTSE